MYGFDDLNPLQLGRSTRSHESGAPVTVSLSYEEGRTAFAGRAATYQALAPLAAEHQRLASRADYYAPGARAALSHLERRLFELDAPRLAADGSLRLLEGAGERAELELVAGEISRLLADGFAAERDRDRRARCRGAPASCSGRCSPEPAFPPPSSGPCRLRTALSAGRWSACCAACRAEGRASRRGRAPICWPG